MKKYLRTIMSFGLAFLIITLAVVRVFLGYVPASRMGHKAITAANNPASFWATVVFMLLLSLVFFITGIVSLLRSRKRS